MSGAGVPTGGAGVAEAGAGVGPDGTALGSGTVSKALFTGNCTLPITLPCSMHQAAIEAHTPGQAEW